MQEREELIERLRSWSVDADVAAEALADRGSRSALPDILRSILRECGFEYIPDRRIAAFVRLAGPEHVPMLVEELENLDEAELEGDAGDIGDEFWRIMTAIRHILVGIGKPADERIRSALARTQNPFARKCLTDALNEIGSPPPYPPYP